MTTQFDKSESVIVTHYQGLTVAQFGEYMDQVESVLISAGIYYPQPEMQYV